MKVIEKKQGQLLMSVPALNFITSNYQFILQNYEHSGGYGQVVLLPNQDPPRKQFKNNGNPSKF